jgi:hypothetical protein
MSAKPMTTAKELARKAFCDAVKKERDGWFHNFSPEERFESWWSEWYGTQEHKECFNAKHFVTIDRKVYIEAE